MATRRRTAFVCHWSAGGDARSVLVVERSAVSSWSPVVRHGRPARQRRPSAVRHRPPVLGSQRTRRPLERAQRRLAAAAAHLAGAVRHRPGDHRPGRGQHRPGLPLLPVQHSDGGGERPVGAVPGGDRVRPEPDRLPAPAERLTADARRPPAETRPLISPMPQTGRTRLPDRLVDGGRHCAAEEMVRRPQRVLLTV